MNSDNAAVARSSSQAARTYLDLGLAVLDLPSRSKRPEEGRTGWQDERATLADVEKRFPPGEGRNVAVFNGAPSGNLADVDLDCPEAVRAADVLLPATGWVFGRDGARRSHRVYRTDRPFPKATDQVLDADGGVLLELRGSGGYTVWPGSTHRDSGEAVEWDRFDAAGPAEVSLADLERAFGYLAAATLLARHWPGRTSKARNNFALAVAGGLARAGIPVDAGVKVVYAAALAAGDEEAKSRGENARATYTKHAAGERVTGWRTALGILGDEGPRLLDRVGEVLGFGSSPCADVGWPAYIPLGEVPDAPPFPVDVLPERLRRLAVGLGRVINTPVDYCGAAMLALASGAIANSRHLAITAGHTQAPCVYAVLIGSPGCGKTPPVKQLRKAFDKAQREALKDVKSRRKEWNEEDPATRGPKPQATRFVVSNTTTESLAINLNDNPRGLVLIRDELSAFVASMGQYKGGRGDDKQFYLSVWSGDTTIVDRKSDKDLDGLPLFVEDPFLSILGGIQPAVLYKLRGDMWRGVEADDDGFFDRFLPVYPAELPERGETWETVDKGDLEHWETVVKKLLDLRMVQEDGADYERPFFVRLGEEGKRRWEGFTHAHAAEMNRRDFAQHLRGAWRKLRGYAARLALIIHYLRWACGEVADEAVDGVSMAGAVRLVEYFKGHIRKVHAVVDADPVIGAARTAVKWILDRDEPAANFTKRDLHRGIAGTTKTIDQTDKALALLEKHYHVRPLEAAGPKRVGRKASPVYEVHPDLGNPGEDPEPDQADPTPPPDTAPGDLPATGARSVNSVNSVRGCDSGLGSRKPAGSESGEAPESGPSGDFSTPDGIDGIDRTPPGVASAAPPPTESAGYRLITEAVNLPAVMAAIDETAVVALDLETTGLDPRTDRVRLLSVAVDTVDGGSFAYLLDLFALPPEAVAPVLEALARKALLAHNAKFELLFLDRLGCVPAGPVRDTWAYAKVLTAGAVEFNSCDLADCCRRYLDRELDKAEQASDWAGELRPGQLAYAATDVLVLPRLYEALRARAEEEGLAGVAELECRTLRGVAWAQAAGVAVDRPALEKLSAGFTEDADRLRAELDGAAPPKPPPPPKRKKGEQAETLFPEPPGEAGAWNWNSPAQVKQALALAGVPAEKLKSTDDDALARIDHPLAARLRAYRAAQKMAGNYGEAMLNRVAPDGRVYADWKQLGTVAGRMSCGSPNLQQVPKESSYRRCFVAPDGRVLVKADYSQIELRIAAKVSGDRALLEVYTAGGDLHTRTAQAVLGKEEVTKADRQLAKALNFGLLYGMGARGFRQYAKAQYGQDLTEEQAAAYRDAFFSAYPGLKRWHRTVGKTEGPVTTTTLAGRRRLRVESYTQKLNTPVQGTGADGFKAALALLWERRDEVPGAVPVLLVHDEIVVECDSGQAGAVSDWLERAMLDAMGPLIDPVPVAVEVTVGRTWAGD